MLDMGQWLSVPFIIIGIYMIARAMMRPAVTDLDAVANYANNMYAAEDKKRSKKNGKRGK